MIRQDASPRRNLGGTRAALTLVVGLTLLATIISCGGGRESTPTTPPAPSGSPTAVLPTTTITFTRPDRHTVELRVEIADDPAERTRGLMFRESLPEDAGMLFVHEDDSEAGFWMKDTPAPLSIAFVSAAGMILHIEEMEPLTVKLHYSPQPFRYAVEANRGWFASNGIGVGDTVVVAV